MSYKVSVIIPAYNTAKYLPQCLESVLSQDIDDLEAICINDGSPDNSLDIMKSFAAKDSRVHVIDKANEGVGAARNDGICTAKGEFIAFMDSDDFYPNQSVLRKLYEAATEHHVTVAGGHYMSLKENGVTEDCPWSYKNLPLAVSGLTEYRDFQFDYGYWAYLFKTSLIHEKGILFPRYSRFQDPPFFVNAMIAGGRFYALDEATYCYRILPSSGKTSIGKTIDMLKGVIDNLRVSREHGLSRLHYISAFRLYEEASYMAIHNLGQPNCADLLASLIKATAMVDDAWLRDEGFDLPSPFIPEVFTYAAETASKYERLRKNKLVVMLAKLMGR